MDCVTKMVPGTGLDARENALKSNIALAQKFLSETSGKTAQEIAAAVPVDAITDVTQQTDEKATAEKSSEVAEPGQKKTEVVSKTETATPTDKSDNATPTGQTTEDQTSIPETPGVPSEPQAKETVEQVSDRKAADYEQRFGTVINTDNAKLLFKDDGYDPHDAESVKKFHPQASAIIRKLFDKFLKERKGKGNGLVVFTGGGNGSGKSSVMNDQAIKNADFVFDSAMVNYEAAKNSIQQVIDNGPTPLLAFVYRNPADAWFNGVQKRNQSSDGHIVPEGVFANTHAVAKETFLKLVRDFGDNVQYIIKEVADGKASEITLEELENKPKYTKDQIKESINAENYEKAKSILDGFSNQETDNQGYSSDGRSTGRGDRGVSEKSAEGVSGSVTSAESIISKITSAKAGSRERIMAFTELPDGEHTVNGKTFTKKGNAFTLDGKELNAREIEKATRTTSEKMRKTVEETMTDAEVDYTPKAEAQPDQKPTLSDKMRGKGKKKSETQTDNQSEVSEKSDKAEKAERIEDFGEKIGGARKDRYTDTIREKIVDNYTDEEIFGLSVDKLFPKLDYEKLAADGMDKSSIAILKAARETLPHKPSDKWKYKKNGYISAIRQALEVAQSVLDGKMDLETLQKRVDDAYSELADLDRQLEEKKNKFPDGATVTQAEYNQNEKEIFDIYSKKSDVYDRSRLDMKLIDAARAIELINIPMSDYRFDYEILSNATYRNGKQDYNYRSYRINRSIYSLTSRLNDEHSIKDVAKVIEDDLKKRADAKGGKVKGEAVALPKLITVIGHTVSKDNQRKIVYAIASEPGRKGFILKDGFETAKEAADFFRSEEGKKELEKRWAEIKDIKQYNPQESPRQGKDYRNGKNITPQELAETFGFRGVEFGNWADQKNRQKRLNETYDAFMDMAAILGISPKAVGLGGKLGMAFGSRGSGWANAHFESDAFVINITKTRGAGSLAHEWLHALDNYFARQSESQHGMATDMHELNLKNMRDELKEKWMGLRRTLEMSAMKRRSNKHSDYWSRIWEVAARAFSRYIQDKAIANNMSNDYLVSLFPEELLADIQKETTPFALKEDMVAITPAFDAFFDTLQEKVDESGSTVLFSMLGDQRGSIQRRDQTLTEIANLDMKNEITKVIEEGVPEGKYVFKSADDKQKIIDGAVKFLKDFSKKIVSLSDGRIVYFMPDSRAFERGSATAWAEYGIHAVTSSGKQIPGKDYNERLFNQHKLDNLDRIVPTIKDENVFGKFDNKNPVKDGVIFVGTSHDGKRLEVITRLDEYGNPQADLTEVTVVEKNPQRKVPPLAPLTEVVEAVARHQEAGYSPSTTDNITFPDSKVNPSSSKNPENSSGGAKFSKPSDTPLGDTRINWDNKNGMGAMGDNANIDYRGFQIELAAKDFRNLTPSGRMTTDLTKMKQSIEDGKGIASPTLYADWNEQKKRWEVTDHEGRSRSDAISELYGADTLMPVHVIPYKLRARDITPEMLNAPFVGQGLSGYDWATEYNFLNSRREVASDSGIRFSKATQTELEKEVDREVTEVTEPELTEDEQKQKLERNRKDRYADAITDIASTLEDQSLELDEIING